MTSNQQLCLFPARRNDGRAALHGLRSSACIGADFTDRMHTQVRQYLLFHVCPDVFDRIELRYVGGQALQHEAVTTGLDVVANNAVAVSGRPVPDQLLWSVQWPVFGNLRGGLATSVTGQVRSLFRFPISGPSPWTPARRVDLFQAARFANSDWL